MTRTIMAVLLLLAGCATTNGGNYPLSECREEAVIATGIRADDSTANMALFDRIYRQCVLRPLEVTIRVVDSPNAPPSAVTGTIDLPAPGAAKARERFEHDAETDARTDAQQTLEVVVEETKAKRDQ